MTFFRIFFLLLLIPALLLSQTIKVATYNIYFLDDGISAERKANLQEVLQKLDADIIAFEEITNQAALENILSDDYQIAMVDDSTQVQELALAARKPLKIVDFHLIYTDGLYDLEFPRTRDLLQVVVEGYGQKFVCLVHHAKSRRGGRMNNDSRREGAAKLIVKHIRQDLSGENVILLGDFNDTADDRSLNILEYGTGDAAPGIDTTDDTFLYNTTEDLLEKNYCSHGFSYMYRDTLVDQFNPVVPGSRAENNKWRGKEYDYYKDVKIKESLLDQILVSMNLKDEVSARGVFHDGVAVRGASSRIRFGEHGLEYTRRGGLASDHVPVWIELSLRDEQGVK